MDYLLEWSINWEDLDPLSAAEAVLNMLRDPDHTATIFYVTDEEAQRSWMVDVSLGTIREIEYG